MNAPKLSFPLVPALVGFSVGFSVAMLISILLDSRKVPEPDTQVVPCAGCAEREKAELQAWMAEHGDSYNVPSYPFPEVPAVRTPEPVYDPLAHMRQMEAEIDAES